MENIKDLYQKAIKFSKYRKNFLNIIRKENLFPDINNIDIYHYKVYYNNGKPYIENIFNKKRRPILIKDWNMLNIDKNYIQVLI